MGPHSDQPHLQRLPWADRGRPTATDALHMLRWLESPSDSLRATQGGRAHSVQGLPPGLAQTHPHPVAKGGEHMTTKQTEAEAAAAAAEAEAEVAAAEAAKAPPTVPAGTIDSEGTFRPS